MSFPAGHCAEPDGGLYHWGLKNVARSTVADTTNSRTVSFFRDLFAEMYGQCRGESPEPQVPR